MAQRVIVATHGHGDPTNAGLAFLFARGAAEAGGTSEAGGEHEEGGRSEDC